MLTKGHCSIIDKNLGNEALSDVIEMKGGEEEGLVHEQNECARKKNQGQEKRKIGIEKLTFHYVVLDSRDQ